MKNIKATAVGCLLAAGFAWVPAVGGAADFYAGLGLGQTKTKDYADYVRNNFDDGSITSASFDDSDTGLRLFVGAAFNPNFSIELGHVDLGEATTDAQSNGCCFYFAGPVEHSASADGLDLSAVGRIPLSEAAGVLIRAGMFKWDVKERIADSSGSASGSDDGSDFFYALGGEYRAGAQFGLRAEYAFYTIDADGGEFDVSMLSASATYYFTSK